MKNAVTYYGCIGDDEQGKVLQKDLTDNGITGNFHIEKTEPTGKCAVVVVENERSLLAHLAAACKYNLDHLHANMEAM